MLKIIEKTRDRIPLTGDEIQSLIEGLMKGDWPDYQVSAWLMAVYCRGLSEGEIFRLTEAMAFSGSRDISPLGRVDKHSTGGVGDKTTLVLAPLVASLGIPVAKMSGRGLGHTGGTLDKLESIPGFRIGLSRREVEKQVAETGVAVYAQSVELAPADKKLYALRDVTCTVDSIPLIASSIMSKKIACGSPNLVLDIKVGSGAFMPSPEPARELARLMIRIGTHFGMRVAAILTNMDQPLGYAVGNAVEVNEACACLRGHGPQDLRREVIALASHMTALAKNIAVEDAAGEVIEALDQGKAWQKFKQWISAQGGDLRSVESGLEMAPYREVWAAGQEVAVQSVDTRLVGMTAMELGAGRRRLEDRVDPLVGILCYAKTGRTFAAGETIAEIFARSEETAQSARRCLETAIRFGPKREKHDEPVLEVLLPKK